MKVENYSSAEPAELEASIARFKAIGSISAMSSVDDSPLQFRRGRRLSCSIHHFKRSFFFAWPVSRLQSQCTAKDDGFPFGVYHETVPY